MTVICVDDHPIMLSGLLENVSQVLPDAIIVAFKNAEDALCYTNENGCDVLISEIELCGTDGLTLAKKIKMINSKVNIIFFTVCDEKEHAKEVLKIKPSGYLVKPAKASLLIMQISLKTMTEDAVIYADSEEMNGFAVWLPFGFTGSKTIPFLLNGGLRLILHSGPGIIGRLLTYETYAMNLKKAFTDNYDWYLYNLSIKKDAQGKGIASKLMRPMLQFCDDERMVAYLETNKAANVSLYQHYGFDLMKEELIPKTPVTHYAMVRNPHDTE